jgi:hypothetical protein
MSMKPRRRPGLMVDAFAHRTWRWRSARVRLAADFKALRVPDLKKENGLHASDMGRHKKKVKEMPKSFPKFQFLKHQA